MTHIEHDERRTGKPWATKSGVIVGGAYVKRQRMDADSEALQAALLTKPERRIHRVLDVALPIFVLFFILFLTYWKS